MIYVVGWPRSGTSLLMQILIAAGLRPWANRRDRPFPGNPHGVWELGTTNEAPVAQLRRIFDADLDPDSCVKLFHRHLAAVFDADLWPDVILMTKRPVEHVIASWAACWPDRTPAAEQLLAHRLAARRLIKEAGVPLLEVPIPDVVDDAVRWIPKIAKFVQPRVSFPVNEEAMLGVPQSAEIHFR